MKKLFLLLPVFFLFQCKSEKEDTKPENLLSADQMTNILIDVHIAEALTEIHVPLYDSAQVMYERQEKQILKKHQVSEPQFRTSYDYYLKQEEVLDKIYERVIDSLSMMEVKAQTKREGSVKPAKEQQ
ncbi:MAG: DUF4296 domain-containing protein [Hymenobacteraceae bacterium]|nr:DUF4296 domain-containing protein [Hymenobacteraceae bacterium]MDX5394923.1 DUF4296 domain-containing protein [Hymenobacteraceae bacterium]MDX5444038.1 DUF4296 domain-containing protein [Hymenobacteraceae bacterium]MDX5510958.1 DUF4296 domain-containing protein [Hymenobacteraceae bacterium]